jgi:hypothetical protein
MGQHQDSDSLELIDLLAQKGKELGYYVEKECLIADGDYSIDLVWKYKREHDPLITFEVETSNRSGIFSNTLKIFGTEQSLVRKPYWHFAIIHKAELTRGQKNSISLILKYNNISLYENIFHDEEKLQKLVDELDHLMSNPRANEEPIISFIRSSALFDSGTLSSALAKFGGNLPYLLQDDFVPQGENHPYFSIPTLLEYLNHRLPEIHYAKDIREEDFEAFMKITKLAERLDAKENLLLHNKICPKCGSKITERQIYHGCSESHPEPDAITYIIGCESCDYVINEETIDI